MYFKLYVYPVSTESVVRCHVSRYSAFLAQDREATCPIDSTWKVVLWFQSSTQRQLSRFTNLSGRG